MSDELLEQIRKAERERDEARDDAYKLLRMHAERTELANKMWDCATTLWLQYPQGQPPEKEDTARAAFLKVDELARNAGILARPVKIVRPT